MKETINLQQVKQDVQEAITLLASWCDGAHKKDYAGFNAFDADFGRSLSEWINSGKDLTDGQFKAAWKMVKKYQGQLPMEIPAFKASYFEKANGKGKKSISVSDGQIHIIFGGRPSPQDRKSLDSLKFRRWNPNLPGLPWVTNINEVTTVNQLFGNRHEWNYIGYQLQILV